MRMSFGKMVIPNHKKSGFVVKILCGFLIPALIFNETQKRHHQGAFFVFGGEAGILCAFWHFPPRVGGAGKCCAARDFGVRSPSAPGSYDEPLRASHPRHEYQATKKSIRVDGFLCWRRSGDSNPGAGHPT